MKKRESWALVTGASGGIGLELADLLARDGYNLVLVARNREKLEAISRTLTARFKIEVVVIAKDLAQTDSSQETFDEIARRNLEIEILVNNAGFGDLGIFAGADAAKIAEMLHVNITSLTLLTRLFLPQMLGRKRGRVLNVASMAAFQAGPLMAVYYASKAYVLSLSEALSNETAGSGVTVTCLCPGATETGFQERAQMKTSNLFAGGAMSAHEVANIGYLAMKRGQTSVIAGRNNKLWAFATRFLSRQKTAEIARRVQENTKL